MSYRAASWRPRRVLPRPAGRGLPAALAHAQKRRRVAAKEDAASSSADQAAIDVLRARLTRELARAVKRSDEQGERRTAGH